MPIRAVPASAGFFGQGIKYPFEIDDKGRLKLSSGPPLVEESVLSITCTQPHERPMNPTYGADIGTFDVVGDTVRTTAMTRRSIGLHEPRVNADSVEVSTALGERPGEVFRQISYAVINEADSRTLTYPIFTGPAATGASE